MKIGIDAGSLQHGHSQTGLYQYTAHLISELQAIDRGNEYTLFFFNWRDREADAWIDAYPVAGNVRKRVCRIPYRVVRALDRLPLGSPREAVDVFHGPSFRPPPMRWTKRSLVTIHDLAFVSHPRFFPDAARASYYRTHTRDAIRRAEVLVAVSEFTRGCLMDAFGVAPNRVRVIPPGIGAEFATDQDPASGVRVRTRYGIAHPYVLFVGYLEAKKNVSRLVQAFARLKPVLPVRHQLVLAGPHGPAAPEIRAAIDERNLHDDVILTGQVPRADLPALYAGAAVFAFPSLYEGFGIPPLEAMACGVPVVASHAAALPEIIGPAAVLVDPLNVDEIAHALARVLGQPELGRKLRERGLVHAARFSWTGMATRLLALYRELAP